MESYNILIIIKHIYINFVFIKYIACEKIAFFVGF